MNFVTADAKFAAEDTKKKWGQCSSLLLYDPGKDCCTLQSLLTRDFDLSVAQSPIMLAAAQDISYGFRVRLPLNLFGRYMYHLL
jgi:hypothetical protein